MTDYQIISGDCIEAMRKMEDNSVDAIVTDPPYGIGFKSNKRKASAPLGRVANDGSPFVWWLGEAARVLKDDGGLVVFHRWDVAELWRSVIECAGLTVRSQIVWSKGGGGMGDLRRQFAPSHEPAFFACKKPFAFPSGRPGTSVFEYPKVPPAQMVHPTEKPHELMRELCRLVTPPGGTVLDPFMGSGSTGKAAMLEGFKFIGIELDADYCAIARDRITKAQEDAPPYTATA